MKGLGKLLFVAGLGAAAGAGIYYAKKFIEETDAEEVMEGVDDDYDVIDENGEAQSKEPETRDYVDIPVKDAQTARMELDEAVENDIETEELITEDEEEAQ